jgi:hypothetical protein
MFSSSKTVVSKLSRFLPDEENLLSLDQYNKLYKDMLERRKEVDSKENVEQIEDQHRTIIASAISGKIKSMKKERQKNHGNK